MDIAIIDIAYFLFMSLFYIMAKYEIILVTISNIIVTAMFS